MKTYAKDTTSEHTPNFAGLPTLEGLEISNDACLTLNPSNFVPQPQVIPSAHPTGPVIFDRRAWQELPPESSQEGTLTSTHRDLQESSFGPSQIEYVTLNTINGVHNKSRILTVRVLLISVLVSSYNDQYFVVLATSICTTNYNSLKLSPSSVLY